MNPVVWDFQTTTVFKIGSRSTTAILSAKTDGSLSASPTTKVSGHGSSSGSDWDKDRWVWSGLASRGRGGSISNFIFVASNTAILSPLASY